MRVTPFSNEPLWFIRTCCFLACFKTAFGFSPRPETSTVSRCNHHRIQSTRQCQSHRRFMTSMSETNQQVYTDKGRIDLVSLQADVIHSNDVEILSKDPLVYVIPNFLSIEECQSYQTYVERLSDRNMTKSNPPDVSLDVTRLWPLPLISLMAGIPPVLHRIDDSQPTILVLDLLLVAVPNVVTALIASTVLAYGVVLPLLRLISKRSSRTSVAVALNTEADHALVRNLVDKVENITKHPWTNWEAPVVTRYDPGAIFSRHGDASPIRGEEWKDKGGQRVITCICYLNTLQQGGGGETFFDRLNIAVKPEAGKALFFFPADGVTWIADDRTTHESKPPSSEEKWIVQMFGRAQRVPPPLGLTETFRF